MMYVKYPSTPHMPSSPGRGDDGIISRDDMQQLLGGPIVISIKMDGENTTLYRDHMHARSLDSRGGPERDWIKAFHAGLRHQIPEGWRICGENLYARHSIAYDALTSYFQVFSVWDSDTCLSWQDTLDVCKMLDLCHVPIVWDETTWPLASPGEQLLAELYRDAGMIVEQYRRWTDQSPRDIVTAVAEHEGFVIRNSRSFGMTDFRKNICKWVRKDHVKTDDHWRNGPIIQNGLQR